MISGVLLFSQDLVNRKFVAVHRDSPDKNSSGLKSLPALVYYSTTSFP